MEKRVSLAWSSGIDFTATSEDGVSVELGGVESPGTFRPAAMLLVALGGCTGMDAISILTKKRVGVTELRSRGVAASRRTSIPSPTRRSSSSTSCEGTSIDDAAVARAVELSARKYCAVGATIAQGETTIEHRTRIIDENGERTCECLVIGPRGAGLAGAESREAVGASA